MGILLTLYSPRPFLKHLKQEISGRVNSSNATLEAEFATLIGRPPRMEYRRSKPVLPREATFMEMWNEAKHYIYRCLWKGGWRYKVSPMIQNFSGDRHRLIMRPDWQLSLSKNSRHDLEDLNLAHSTQTGEYFPRHFGSARRRKWEPARTEGRSSRNSSRSFSCWMALSGVGWKGYCRDSRPCRPLCLMGGPELNSRMPTRKRFPGSEDRPAATTPMQGDSRERSHDAISACSRMGGSGG